MALTLLCLSLLSLLAPHTQRAVIPDNPVQLAGQVVDAASRLPLADTRITLIPMPPPSPRMPPFQTLTDEKGRFQFTGLPAGRYRASAHKPGFVRDADDIRTINITGGQSAATTEFALRRGGVIAGRILDARGEALPYIRVMASRRRPESGDRLQVIASEGAETNDLGEFRISGLPAGTYIIAAAPPPQPPFDQSVPPGGLVPAPTYHPGTTNRESAQAVIVGDGEIISGLNFSIVSAPAFHVSGVVVDPQGRPIVAAEALLFSDPRTAGAPTPAMARSNGDGTFRFTGIPSGAYALTIVMPNRSQVAGGVFVGGSTVVATRGMRMGPPDGSTPSRIDVDVDGADVTGLKLVLPARQ